MPIIYNKPKPAGTTFVMDAVQHPRGFGIVAMEEIWKSIEGYEGLYEVSSLGEVRSVDRINVARNGVVSRYSGRPLRPTKSNGYPVIKLSKNGKQVTRSLHRLVIESFVGPKPEGCQACHYDGNKSNAALSNLRWDTPTENSADKVRHGTNLCGDKHPRATLTWQQVIEIRSAVGTNSEVAHRYACTVSAVSQIRTGKTWTKPPERHQDH